MIATTRVGERLYMSPPHIGPDELPLVMEAFETNWLAPVGPHLDAFEEEFAVTVGAEHAVALSSGTAALHLAMRVCGIGEGDEVLVSNLTFCASVNPILYEGGVPVLVDSELRSWNLDPNLVEDFLRARARSGRLPKALVAVHLYGQCADLDALVDLCERYDVTLIEDAAEALGALYWGKEAGRDPSLRSGQAQDAGRGSDFPGGAGDGFVGGSDPAARVTSGLERRPSPVLEPPSSDWQTENNLAGRAPGVFGRVGVYSFNGNKIITTAGGGMLVTDEPELAAHARKLATQAREDAAHYEHTEIGYNYRMSNILAGIGRGQLPALEDRVAARRRNFAWYRAELGDLPGVAFMPEADWGRHSRWLTVMTLDPAEAGADPETVRLALEDENIEARPVWKPMHLQPAYEHFRAIGGAVSEQLFATGLCLPSGSAMTRDDVQRVSSVVRSCMEG